jgi:hypothetical protein
MRADMHPTPYVLVATVAANDATTTLFFRRAGDRVPLRLTELVPRSFRHPVRSIRAEAQLAGELAGAAALIVSRGLFEFGNLIDAARSLGMPRCYFVDDNLMVLRAEGHADARHARGYSDDNVRRALHGFDGVLCATAALRSYFIEHRLHDRVELYPPIAGRGRSPRPRTDQALRLAFFGGGHRREAFVRIVWPAIERFAAGREVTLCVAGLDDVRLEGSGRVRIEAVPYVRDYAAALEAMADRDIDILLHPSSDTANNPYKNPHVLINARAIGAVPIFSDAPPYDAVAGEGVCLLADQTSEGWLAALKALDDADVRERMSRRIDGYCARHFNGAVNVRRLEAMLGGGVAPRQGKTPLLPIKLGSGVVVDMLRRAILGRS